MTCAKGSVIAVIRKGSQFWVGSNHCDTPRYICPRRNMPTGKGYHLCKSVCGQQNHAEVDACLKAGGEAEGADLYLIGHSYCCVNCMSVMKSHGIKNIIFTQEADSE